MFGGHQDRPNSLRLTWMKPDFWPHFGISYFLAYLFSKLGTSRRVGIIANKIGILNYLSFPFYQAALW